MLVGFLAALAAAIVFLTFLQTASAYPTLPDRVPVHLDASGLADGFGPKFMIWLIPAIQVGTGILFLFGGHAIASNAPGTHGTLLGSAIIGVCVVALTWRVQLLLIEAAKNAGKRAQMRGFWMFFVVWMCVVLFDAFVIR